VMDNLQGWLVDADTAELELAITLATRAGAER